MEVSNTVQEVVPEPSQEKEMQENKMVVWGSVTNSWEKLSKAKEKRKDRPNWMQSSREYQEEIRKPS